MFITDRFSLTAPAPSGPLEAQAVTVGTGGLRTYYYWLVSHFPIGPIASGPISVYKAAETLGASNYVYVVWQAAAGATTYDLLRTDSAIFPGLPGNYAVAIGLTTTSFNDQIPTPASFNPIGLQWGAPVSAFVQLDNRNYSEPVLDVPTTMRITKILFSDGSEQATAGTGTATPMVTSVFGRGGAVAAVAGDYNASQITLTPAVGGWANVQTAIAGLNTASNAVPSVFGRTGAITAAAGDYNAGQITLSPAVGTWTNVQQAIAGLSAGGVASVNGATGAVTFAGGAGVTVSTAGSTLTIEVATAPSAGATAPTNPQMGTLWYNMTTFRLMVWLGSWVQAT